MASNVKIPASYNSTTIFTKAKAKFIKGIRSNIQHAISTTLWEAYKDKGTPEMHGSHFKLMKMMRDMVSSHEIGNLLLKDCLPHHIDDCDETKIQEEMMSLSEIEEYPSMVKLEPAVPTEIKQEFPAEIKQEFPVEINKSFPLRLNKSFPFRLNKSFPLIFKTKCTQ